MGSGQNCPHCGAPRNIKLENEAFLSENQKPQGANFGFFGDKEGNTNWLLVAFCCLIPFCCMIPQCSGGGGSFLPTDSEWEQMSDEEKGKAIADEIIRNP